MEGTLVVKEERGVIDKFRSWYKEKIVDTGVSPVSEKIFVKSIEFFEKAQASYTNGAAVVLAIFAPEALGLVPCFKRFQKCSYDAVKSIGLKAKRAMEGTFVGVDGSCKDVVIPEISFEQVLNDVKNGASTVNDVMNSLDQGGKIR